MLLAALSVQHVNAHASCLARAAGHGSPVPVSLIDVVLLLVQLGRDAVHCLQHRPPRPQAHSAAHVLGGDLRHEHHCWVGCRWVELS